MGAAGANDDDGRRTVSGLLKNVFRRREFDPGHSAGGENFYEEEENSFDCGEKVLLHVGVTVITSLLLLRSPGRTTATRLPHAHLHSRRKEKKLVKDVKRFGDRPNAPRSGNLGSERYRRKRARG